MFTHRWYAVSSMNTGMTLTQEVDQLIHALYLDTMDAHTKTSLLAYKTKKILAVLGLVTFLEVLGPYLGGDLPHALINTHCLQLSIKINSLMAARGDLWNAFEHRQRAHRLSEEDVASLKNKINSFTGILLKKYYLFIVTLLEPLTLSGADLLSDLTRIVHEDVLREKVDVQAIPSISCYEYQAIEGLLGTIRLSMPR